MAKHTKSGAHNFAPAFQLNRVSRAANAPEVPARAHFFGNTDAPHDRVLDIVFPPAGTVRARKVVSRSKSRGSGKYPSRKMGRSLHWESPHEQHAFSLLEAHPDVLTYREQPAVIAFMMKGKRHIHYPDLEIVHRGGKEFWEVKPIAELADSEVLARSALLERDLPRFGYFYRIATAEDLAVQPRLGTAQKLVRQGTREMTLVEREHARRFFDQRSRVSWGELLDGVMGPSGLQHACRLVLEGKLFVEQDFGLTRDTFISREKGTSAPPSAIAKESVERFFSELPFFMRPSQE